MLTDVETWRPATQLRGGPSAAATPAPDLIEDEDLPLLTPATEAAIGATTSAPPARPSVLTADDRLALMEQLEREALSKRFQELDRRSEELAAEQQRRFAERLDAAIAAEVEQLRDHRAAAAAELDAWAVAERRRVTGELAAEEQRFGERLMAQLSDFETQLGERLREQEQKLAGWWSEAERLADERMRAALRDVPTT
ncbi:MAG TPA: hypothetical protein VIM50_01925 [Candidatus Limnocylindria bacterium]